jgi:hypothetical protein
LTTIEAGPDDTVIVRGLSIGEVRTRLLPRLPGRPPGPEITRAEILAALASRREWLLDSPTQRELAADIGVSRTRLREAVGRNYGGWRQLLTVSAQRDGRDSTS